ncbi:MAG: beta-ketoacyl synthase N-terminal-like domain-containing protein [Candidatus Competibacteraceae bacterium]
MVRTGTPVYITGVGCMLPTGDSVLALWNCALAGRSAITRYHSPWCRCSWLPWYGRVAAADTAVAYRRFPAGFRRLCSEPVLWGIAAAERAVVDAELDLNDIAPDRRGLFTAGSNCSAPGFHFHQEWTDNRGDEQERMALCFSEGIRQPAGSLSFSFTETTGTSLLTIAARLFQCRGDSGTYGQDDWAAVTALRAAFRSLRHGYSDLALVICTNRSDEPWTLCEAYAHKQLSRCSDGAESLRPYDRRRDGMVLGEGAVALLLETERSVRRRGVTPLGELSAFGSMVVPSYERRRRDAYAVCLEQVLYHSGLTPLQIGTLCAHGKGLWLGDPHELRMLECALGPLTPTIPITCMTPLTGVVSATGVCIEVLICLEMLRYQVVPPIAHLEEPELTSLALCRCQPVAFTGRHALALIFGLSGFHAAILLHSP